VRDWVHKLRRQFRFVSAGEKQPLAVQYVEEAMVDQQKQLMSQLAEGADRLRALCTRIHEERQVRLKKLDEAREQLQLVERNTMHP
jgi:hypothetical protein